MIHADSRNPAFLFPTMKSQGAAKNAANNEAQVEKTAVEEKPAEKIDFSNVKIEPLFEEMVDFDTFSKSDFRAVKIEACEAVPKSKKLLKFTLNDGTDRKRTILSGIHEYYEPEELVGNCLLYTSGSKLNGGGKHSAANPAGRAQDKSIPETAGRDAGDHWNVREGKIHTKRTFRRAAAKSGNCQGAAA